MMQSYHWGVVVLFIACLQLAACGQTSVTTASENQPAKVERIQGTELSRVTLTADAARRLDLQTATVRDMQVNGTPRKVIPYAALLYDAQGNTWTYMSHESLTFERSPITVDFIDGDQAVLSAGPPSGTVVVTVGAEELYGSETEFKEE
jgi:hypothetical protein